MEGASTISEPIRLTLDDRQDLPFDWTPDDKSVLFISDRTGIFSIYRQAIDQTVPELLVGGNYPVLTARLSPDSTQLLYLVYPSWTDNVSSISLMRMPVAGGAPQLILQARWISNQQCARSPATECLYSVETDGRFTIFRFDPLKGSGPQVYQIKDDLPQAYNWSLSPDGTTLAIAKGKVGEEEPRIHLISLKSGTERWLPLQGLSGVGAIDWAADSKSLWASSVGDEENALLNIDLHGNARTVWRPKKKEHLLGDPIARWPVPGSARQQQQRQRLDGGTPLSDGSPSSECKRQFRQTVPTVRFGVFESVLSDGWGQADNGSPQGTARRARMSSLGARAVVFCFSVIFGWLPLAAQSFSYHLEFDDRILGSQQVILVNDSEKSIEAFGASQRCHKARGGSGNDSTRDVLDNPSINGVSSDMQAAVGSGPPRSGVLETGARWRTAIAIFPENGDCQNQITAVFFSDGSFEGEDAGVRGLKAHRDGLAAGIHYWADRISREKPDGSTLNALQAEIKQRMAEDQMKQQKFPIHITEVDTPPLLWQYWSGWLQVESTIEFHFPKDLSQGKASENFRRVADEINQWKTKIDGNLALQKLNIAFPAISESSESEHRQ